MRTSLLYFKFIVLSQILRDILCYKPPITKEQFFVTGYAERKILMCRDIIHLVHTQYRPSPVGRPSKSKLPSSAKSQEQVSYYLPTIQTKKIIFSSVSLVLLL